MSAATRPKRSTIDLNSDLGEGFGAFRVGPDEELFPFISSANVACGFHGGDPRMMSRTVEQARKHNVAVGAHPGFPDLAGFGRRNIAASAEEIRTDVLYQIGAMAGITRAEGAALRHVKAHGALYNMAVKDPVVAEAIARAVRQFDAALRFFVIPGSALEAAAITAGLTVVREAFADRAYHADGSLVSRSVPGAVIEDAELVAARVIRLVEEGVIETIEGDLLTLEADTICIHSDTATAVPIARAISARFARAGIDVRPSHPIEG
ncbi:MAG: Lactam utilization protein LamB [uncultured Thermomicrobiales bacterium]|uniref:5-oxoprolinase subunit A n=1 Tax=uncultured Thermomicrobiales bacterium TaxID=1645740 RepID=A0A6J4VP55_9BACT|nr:MAG: Lactam utilization protein LamB [uncultured Thermomicrobiales bacterium]